MNTPKTPLSSLQNERIKQCIKLQQRSRSRKQSGLFCIEGAREIERAILGGYVVEQYFRSTANEASLDNYANILADISSKTVWVTPKIMEELCYRESTSILAVARQKKHDFSAVEFQPDGLYLLVEGIEKPGNLGALLRTAGGIGLTGVIVVNKQTDVYHPNCIRNSMGAVFQIPIAVGEFQQLLPLMEEKKLAMIGAALTPNAIPLHTVAFKRPCIIAVGNEAEGLSNEVLSHCHRVVQIPMKNAIDSLNVSVAAAIFMYQALQASRN